MIEDGVYACAMLLEMTLFCIYVFGIVFLFSPGTEVSGFITLAYANFALLVVTTYNTYRAGREDLIAFSLFCSVGLSLVGILFCVFFFNRIQQKVNIFGQPSSLNGLPRDILNLFKTIFIPIFVITTVLMYMYLKWQRGTSDGENPAINAQAILYTFYSAYSGTADKNEVREKEKYYVMTASILSCVLLALTAYNVYVANFLKSIVLLS